MENEMRLSKKIREMILKHKIKLEVSDRYSDYDGTDLPEEIEDYLSGLFVYDKNNFKRSIKTIWLRKNLDNINDVALHELGHFIALTSFPENVLATNDKDTEHWVHELLAEGAMLGMSFMLRRKIKRSTIRELKDKVLDIKVREKKN